MTDISRRKFIRRVGATSAALPALSTALAAQARGGIPKRVLGRTKREVSILAFGGGSRFLAYKSEEEGIQALHRALDLGITYVDSSTDYGKGDSEIRIGKALGARRKDIFLATKADLRDYDGVMRTLEQSLKRMQIDYLDLFHLHGLGPLADLEKIEKEGGLKALYKAREQKMATFIGMSCHQEGAVLKTAIERHDLDCVQMALNASRANQFEELALPAAKKKNLGVIAMKIAAQDKIVGAGAGKAGIESLLRYTLSLPVTAAVIGMPKLEMLEQNVAIARAFKPLQPAEMDGIYRQVAPSQAAVARFFSDHLDA